MFMALLLKYIAVSPLLLNVGQFLWFFQVYFTFDYLIYLVFLLNGDYSFNMDGTILKNRRIYINQQSMLLKWKKMDIIKKKKKTLVSSSPPPSKTAPRSIIHARSRHWNEKATMYS